MQDFDCRISKGEYVSIYGTSGIGISTLFNLIIGLRAAESDEIKMDDAPLTRNVRTSWMKMIGYVPQEIFIFMAP